MANPWANKIAAPKADEAPKVATPAPSANSKLANMFAKKPAAPAPAPAAQQSKPMTIESLDDLDLSEFNEPPAKQTFSQFSDETPATKPTRELPEDLEKTQLQFVQMMDGVYDMLDDPQLLAGVIRNIMVELKANPQYAALIADEDVRVWIRSMRENMGLARIKKQEAKAKRGSSPGKKTAKVDNDMADAMADLGIDLSEFN